MRNLIRSNSFKQEQQVFTFLINDKTRLSKLEWGDDEFSYDGKMYDVIEKKAEGDKLIIHCINDKKETELLNKLTDSWKENERSNKIANDLFQFMQTLFHENDSRKISQQSSITYSSLFLLDKLPLQTKKIPTPPPQAIISHLI